MALLASLLAVAAGAIAPALAAAPSSTAIVLRVHDAIGPASADYVERGIAQAAEEDAPLVVIELDTPGGLDTSMRQVIRAILAAPMPVVVHVWPEGARAASAGTYILYAAHVAAMAPATTLGAATPVAIGIGGLRPGAQDRPEAPKAPPGPGASSPADGDPASPPPGARREPSPTAPTDASGAKAVNDAAAFIRGLAQLRGRNVDWAEQAVREAVSLTATEALAQGVIDVIAADTDALLKAIDGRTVRVGEADRVLATAGMAHRLVLPDARHRLLSAIASPSVALVLMMIGVYGLILEFSQPGFGVAGITGAICLLLGLFALQMLPFSVAGLALIVLGLALMGAELLAPGFGVLGGGGVVAFIAGALLLFDRDVPGFGVPMALIVLLAATSLVTVLGAGGMALKARRRPVVSGTEELVGAVGVVDQALDGEAWAQVHGERWRVRASSELARGQSVRVRGVDGLVLEVEPEADAVAPGAAASAARMPPKEGA